MKPARLDDIAASPLLLVATDFDGTISPLAPTPDEACGNDGTREIPQAVSLVFRFVFEQVDGRGSVRVGE